jgi:hypothetical protein
VPLNDLELRWTRSPEDVVFNAASDPCPGTSLDSTAIGKNCFQAIWQYFGCTTGTDYSPFGWEATQTYRNILADSRLWATLPTSQHRNRCYGSDEFQAQYGNACVKPENDCVESSDLEFRWTAETWQIIADAGNPCPGVGLHDTSVGGECFQDIWEYFGCVTTTWYTPGQWEDTQSYHTLLLDAKAWATLEGDDYRMRCYGTTDVSAPYVNSCDKQTGGSTATEAPIVTDAMTSGPAREDMTTTTWAPGEAPSETEYGCIEVEELEARWRRVPQEIFEHYQNPCSDVGLDDVAIGAECYDKVWKYYGCATETYYNPGGWEATQSYRQILSDSLAWATWTTEVHRDRCYGGHHTNAQYVRSCTGPPSTATRKLGNLRGTKPQGFMARREIGW